MQTSILHRLFWGMAIVLIGVIFLLNQLGIISMGIGDIISTFWPVILIVIGIQGMLMQHNGGGLWWNPIVMLIGFFFLGRNLGLYDWSVGDAIRMFWPVALILFGLGMIFQNKWNKKPDTKDSSEKWNPITPPVHSAPPMPPGPPPAPPELEDFERRHPSSMDNEYSFGSEASNAAPKGPNLSKNSIPESHSPPPPRSSSESSSRKQWDDISNWGIGHDWSNPNSINHSRFIGDVHLGNDHWELNPMNISMFIGDTTIDLTKAQIPFGETKLHVSSFIGDVKVFVPNDLGVGIQVVSSCLIGDVKVLDQKREGFFNQMSVETPSYIDTDKKIVLVVSSFIGDVRVTKVG